MAHLSIDTSDTHLHQLRDIIRHRVDQRPRGNLTLLFESFGFKHGVPPDADMIFDVQELISFLSGSTTLVPGTVILTGTPPGVGMASVPPRWLQPGDMVEIEIEAVGTLRNPVVEEARA